MIKEKATEVTEKFRFATVLIFLSLGILFTFLNIEQFPFSNYPMFSSALKNRFRYTLAAVGIDGSRRLVSPIELKPIGRIHLGFLILNATRGNNEAQKSIERLAHGILANDSNLEKIEIVAVQIDRASTAEITYEYKILRTLQIFTKGNHL